MSEKYARRASNQSTQVPWDKDLGQAASSGAAISGAVPAGNIPGDPDLALVVQAWSSLPSKTRRKIVALVESAKKSESNK